MLGKKKQVRKGRSRTSKGKITHHEIGVSGMVRLCKVLMAIIKTFGFYTEWHGKPGEVLSGGVTKIQLSF